MSKLNEISVKSAKKTTNIFTFQNISEQSGVNGFAFSKRFLEKTGLKKKDYSESFFEGKSPFKFLNILKKMAADSEGGPTIDSNHITITIDNSDSSCGSEANYIYMYFGKSKWIKLLSEPSKFSAGSKLTWDLNDIGDWLEDNIATDLWDEIALVTESKDGMRIKKIKIVHSGQIVLNWVCSLWLDGSKDEAYTKIVLTSKILETKLNQIDNLWVPQIHWAAREIGKTDGEKYGASNAWCSDFASWCLRKALWETPTGNIGVQGMENFFSDLGRKISKKQLLKGEYKLMAGDYIRYQWANGGEHSGIFVEYLSDSSKPSESTSIKTIEGNEHSRVAVIKSRTFKQIYSVGNCQ